MNARVVLKGLALIVSLAAIGYLFKTSDLADSINESWIDAHVRSHGVPGALLFLAMGAVFTAIGLPRQIIAFLGGYAFDILLGTLLGALAALLGCMLGFGYARLFGKGVLRRRLGARAQRFDRFLRAHPFSMSLLIRLMPLGSNALTNLAAGISSVPPRPFFAGTFFGYLPQSLVFALVGSGVHLAPGLKFGGAIVLFVVSAALGAYLYRRHRQGLETTPEPDAVSGVPVPDEST